MARELRIIMKAFKFILGAVLMFVCIASIVGQSKRDEGIDLYRAGEFERASSLLIEATQSDKKDSLAWIYLGASLHRLGKGEEAVRAFKNGKVRQKGDVPDDEIRAEMLNRSYPRYTDAARQNRTSGVVRLAVEFGAGGKINFVLPIQPLPDGLTGEAITAAKSTRFRPATKGGKPVTTVELIEYSFEVR
jgi:hypothetical protein